MKRIEFNYRAYVWEEYAFKTRERNTVKHTERENLGRVALYIKFEEGTNMAVLLSMNCIDKLLA